MAPIPSNASAHNADGLAAEVAAGRPLPVLPCPILLSPGEVLHAEGVAEGWRFHGVDVLVEQHRPVASGLLTFGLATVLTSVGNQRALREAERLAAPQWRPLGWMPVLATNQRLAVLHEGAWQSVWYAGIRQLIPSPTEDRLEMVFEADPPYLLLGEWVPFLTIVITTVLAHRHGVDAVASMLQVA